MPLYLADHVKLVAHVHGVVVWLDLVERRRSQWDEAWMGGFVQQLTALVGEHGMAHVFGGNCELHRWQAKTDV